MNAYDVMALLCQKIRSLDKESQSQLYRKYFANIKAVDDTIETYFLFLSKRNGSSNLYDSFSETEVEGIVRYIEDNSPEYWLYLLVYLDGHISLENNFDKYCQKMVAPIQNVYYFKSLAENSAGLIIPNFHSKWVKNNAHSSNELNEDPLSILIEYIWVDKIDGWDVTNIYSPKWESNDKRAYVIVCSPLSDVCPFKFETYQHSDQNSFVITEYIEEEQCKIKTRIEKTLSYANNKKASIVLFPELMVSRGTQSQCSGILKKHWEYEYPRIVCLPSSAFQEDREWKNQTQLLNDSGDALFIYNKQQAFQYEKDQIKYFEPIKPDHQICIIHIKGIGRVGLVICADIFNTQIQEILYEKYRVDLILIMSYTCGTDQFLRDMAVAEKFSCDVVWCNSCSAYEMNSQDKYVVLYLSYGHKERKLYQISKCEKANCEGCGVSIVISPKYKGAGEIEQIFYSEEVL